MKMETAARVSVSVGEESSKAPSLFDPHNALSAVHATVDHQSGDQPASPSSRSDSASSTSHSVASLECAPELPLASPTAASTDTSSASFSHTAPLVPSAPAAATTVKLEAGKPCTVELQDDQSKAQVKGEDDSGSIPVAAVPPPPAGAPPAAAAATTSPAPPTKESASLLPSPTGTITSDAPLPFTAPIATSASCPSGASAVATTTPPPPPPAGFPPAMMMSSMYPAMMPAYPGFPPMAMCYTPQGPMMFPMPPQMMAMPPNYLFCDPSAAAAGGAAMPLAMPTPWMPPGMMAAPVAPPAFAGSTSAAVAASNSHAPGQSGGRTPTAAAATSPANAMQRVLKPEPATSIEVVTFRPSGRGASGFKQHVASSPTHSNGRGAATLTMETEKSIHTTVVRAQMRPPGATSTDNGLSALSAAAWYASASGPSATSETCGVEDHTAPTSSNGAAGADHSSAFARFTMHPQSPSSNRSRDSIPTSSKGRLPIKRTLGLNKNSKDRIHECSMCNKKFTRRSNLVAHIRTHTGEKPYCCTFYECGKRFCQSSNLKRHMKIHAKHRGLPMSEEEEEEVEDGMEREEEDVPENEEMVVVDGQ